MYLADHLPPHFHAIYGEFDASVAIESGEVIKGQLPKVAAGLVREWALANRLALEENWNLARKNLLPLAIGGLDAE